MGKQIETLSQDIYDIIDSGLAPQEETLDKMCNDIKDIVRERFTGYKEDKEYNHLRMSNLGRGTRFLYYDLQVDTQQEISPELKMKFLIGDILEQLMIFLIKESGHEVTMEQAEVELDGIKGHPDAVVDGIPLDIKTASTYAFNDKFVKGNLLNNPNSDGFGYVGQISSYAETLGVNRGAFLAVDKQHGDWTVLLVDEMDMIDARAKIKEVREALEADSPPDEKCFQPKEHKNGNLELNNNCFWCKHKHACHADANDGTGIRTFKYSNKSVDLIHVEKEPTVPEVL